MVFQARMQSREPAMDLFLQGTLILALIAANAFFVAAEYALLTVRRSRLQQLVRMGNSRALLVQKLLAYPSRLFSAIQLGVTAASLLLGWLGESRTFACCWRGGWSAISARYRTGLPRWLHSC